jgi:phage tail sheath protein FI
MAINPTFPGVYVQEISSGVRTIVGVSTSLTAFVGTAQRGPVNKAQRIFSFADFERRYGGLSSDSELSYGVRQFFANGGAEALIVRVARNPQASFAVLNTKADGTGDDVLRIEARDQGKAGDAIQVHVDYQTAVPGSTFNLTVSYSSPDDPGGISESFANLSMNSNDPLYAVDVVNEGSRLVTLTREDVTFATQGTSRSAPIADASSIVLDDTHKILHLSLDGGAPVAITLPTAALASLDDVSEAINDAIDAIDVASRPKLEASVEDDTIVLTSDLAGERSSVRVLSGPKDAAPRLKLGTSNGGSEVDAAQEARPVASASGVLKGGTPGTIAATLPSALANTFRLSLDSTPAVTVFLGTDDVANADEIATLIQTTVRGLRSSPAFKNFTAKVVSGKLVLTSGTSGAGSSVTVDAGLSADIAAALGLLPGAGATFTQGADNPLTGGQELGFTSDQAYGVFIGNRSKRQGLYALDAVPLFNILCLPGVSDPSILSDAVAYAVERRAFLIADPEPGQLPDEMLQVISGPSLPKSDHAAVYYPWVKIADPLKGGKLRSSAPSGTLAGLFARTDAARGVWKAPAGTEATLNGVQDLDYQLSDPENGTLNPVGANCLRILPVFGAVSWGARTLRGADQMASEYKYVPIRRLALFIEQSLYLGTHWAVFEPNDDPLWSQLRLNIGAFMQNLFRQGAFQGRTPGEAYFVKCDKDTTTQNDINLGIVNIVVGFAPLKPAEFVIIKLQQIAGQIAV